MANDVVYRYDAGDSNQPHQTIKPGVGATANQHIQKNSIGADNADFGGGATGNVLNAAGGSGAAALGSFIGCEGKSWMLFKIEYGDATSTRRFRVVAQDFNGTAGSVTLPGTHEPGNTGLKGDTTPPLATLASYPPVAYYIGDAIIASCLGWKQMTLLVLADEATAPPVHAWGVAV